MGIKGAGLNGGFQKACKSRVRICLLVGLQPRGQQFIPSYSCGQAVGVHRCRIIEGLVWAGELVYNLSDQTSLTHTLCWGRSSLWILLRHLRGKGLSSLTPWV